MGESVKPECTPWVRGLCPYSPARSEGLLDLYLDGNEGPPAGNELFSPLLAAGAEALRRYPDRSSLERRLAETLSILPDQVLVTNGADEALERACRAVLAPGRNAVVAEPTFEMIPRYVRGCGAELRGVPWPAGSFPTAGFLERADGETKAIVVVSPNNPTGLVAGPEELAELSRSVPQAMLIVDLAYGEFADEDLSPFVLSLPNAVMIRSFSKAWGLAGLRIGYAAGPAELIAWMRSSSNPYPVSSASLLLAEERLKSGGSDVNRFCSQVRTERSRLAEELEQLGAGALPSQANFVLGEFEDAQWVWRALASLGIAVRSFSGREYLERHLRITCPGEEDRFLRLLGALRTVLAPQALLLDLDGVLADVSGSYRKAILLTAESFGLSLEPITISEAKARGNANNDWELTTRLLAERGIVIPLERVTERFEEFYQGSAQTAGLCLSEKLIPEPSLLESLAERLPLGIVTGRPLKDAEAFLRRTGVRHLFRTIVSMEDALPKPDPAPVILALKRLEVKHAWMVGDTPDDVASARAAGVLPLAVVAPGENRSVALESLTRTGAARVLNDLHELLEML